MTRICFLVPTFNRARFIGEALSAILDQAGGEDEILVVDDGSTDGTEAIVAAFASRVRYLRQDNAGKGAAMNRGLGATEARFLWVCDDDDVLLPGAVQALWDESAHGQRPLVFGNYRRFRDGARGRVEFSPGYAPRLDHGVPLRHVLEDLFVMQNATLVATDAVRAVGGFSETLPRSVDYEFFVRLFASFPARFVDRDIFLQRQHDQVRGPLSAAVPRSQNDQAWLRYDRAIFSSFARHAPIALFEALFDGPAELVSRAALLQRATILARHDCWDLACDDLEAAARCSTDIPTELERAICRRALSGKHGVSGLFRDGVIPRLRKLRRNGGVGRLVVGALMRGGLWRLRSGDWGQAALITRGLAVVGPSALADSIRPVVLDPPSPRLTERRDLPVEVYLRPGTIEKV